MSRSVSVRFNDSRMLPRPEFSQLYKFVAWLGVVLILAGVALPLLVTQQESSLLVSTTTLKQLTPQAAETIRHKQETLASAQKLWPYGSVGLMLAGLLILGWSLREWKRRQDVLDETENLGRDKLRAELLNQSPSEINQRASEAATESAEPQARPRGAADSSGKTAAREASRRVLEIESKVFARLSEALSPEYVGQAHAKVAIPGKASYLLDAVFRSLGDRNADIIIETRYLSRPTGVVMRVSESVLRVAQSCVMYQEAFGRPAQALVIVILDRASGTNPASVQRRFREVAAGVVAPPKLLLMWDDELASIQPTDLRARLRPLLVIHGEQEQTPEEESA